MKIGVLTGGGDVPGLNQAIRGCVLQALEYGWDVIGFIDGWKGLIENLATPLSLTDVEDLMDKGGTIIGTSRTNPYKVDNGVEKVLENIKRLNIDGIVAMGGDDTLGVANRLYKEHKVKVVGVPKTMDNDLSATDYTFGFDSSVTLAVNAAEVLKDSGKSHHRIMVLEVMGRHAGWVALFTALASGADWVLVPEEKVNLDKIYTHLRKVYQRKKTALVIVSEGIEIPGMKVEKEELDQFGHMILKKRAVGDMVGELIEKNLNVSTRVSVIGHMQRGGSPTVFDRMLGLRTGVKAVQLIKENKFGYMAALKGMEIIGIELEQAVGKLKTVPQQWIQLAMTLFK